MAKAKIRKQRRKRIFRRGGKQRQKVCGKGVISNTPILGIGADDATRAAVNRVRSVAGNARDIGVRLNDLNEGLKVVNSRVKDHMVKTGLSRADALKALGTYREHSRNRKRNILSLAAQRELGNMGYFKRRRRSGRFVFPPARCVVKIDGRSAARVATFFRRSQRYWQELHPVRKSYNQ